MKTHLLFLSVILTFPIYALSQKEMACNLFQLKDGEVYYSDIIQIEEASANDLYSTSKIWVAESFQSAKHVIQTDVENSALSLKGLIPVVDDKNINLRINMTIQFKQGRCRYEISNINMVISSIDLDKPIEQIPAFVECNMQTLQKFDLSIRNLIESYRDNLTTADYSW